MNFKVVVISGKMGSGKTTLATALARCAHRHPHVRAVVMNFADTIYEIHDFARGRMKDLGLPTPEGLEVKDGSLLQFLGTEWGRKTYGQGVWAEALVGRIGKFLALSGEAFASYLFIIPDCRFKNELAAFPDALKVRLECPREVRKARCSQWRENDLHQSEVDLDEWVGITGLPEKFDMYFDTNTMPPEGIAELIYHKVSDVYAKPPR